MGLEIKGADEKEIIAQDDEAGYVPPEITEYPADVVDEQALDHAHAEEPLPVPVEAPVQAEAPVNKAPVIPANTQPAESEPSGDVEPASPDQPVKHTTSRPAMMKPLKKLNPTADVFRQISFNMPIGTTFVAHQHAGDITNADFVEAASLYTPAGIGLDALNRPEADWQQHLQHAGRYIAPVTSMPKVAAGTVVNGDAAMALLKRHAGLGVPMEVELPSSCIYLELNSIPDAEIINFHYAFATDRIKLGRDTAGMLLSVRSGVYVERLVRLILSHATWTNVKNLEGGMVESLIRRIDVSDYAVLVNGVMGAQWPDGFPWTLRCHHPSCGHEEPRSLSFPRMHYIDRSMLSEKQLDMLVKNRKAITDEELATYRKEFKALPSSRAVLEDGIVIEFDRPMMDQYFQNTAEWISAIEAQNTRALTDYATANERADFLRAQQQAQALRRYRHYVSRILIPATESPETDEDYYIINDVDTITRQLTALSTMDVRAAEFEAAVLRYIEDTTVGLVAYATEQCPVCKRLPVNEEGEVIDTLVPIAVDKLFFTASRLKTQLLAEIDQQLEK